MDNIPDSIFTRLDPSTHVLTKEKYVDILDKNIDMYVNMKGQLSFYFNETTDKILQFKEKINTAKTKYKKSFYTKKRKNAQNNMIEILQKIEMLNSSINRAKEEKQKIIDSANVNG